MKPVEHLSLFSGKPVELAILSTYNFDPTFFEKRVLRSAAIKRARRIMVLMDADQWRRLHREELNARWLNAKYLVVPVRRSAGVFHPKLALLLRERGFQLTCGSGNLTRSGMTHNLELINRIQVDVEEAGSELRLCHEALAFYRLVLADAVGDAGRIASDWIDEVERTHPWAAAPDDSDEWTGGVELWHTGNKSLWDQLQERIGNRTPKRMLIVSPFFDKDAGLLKRITTRWPTTSIELHVQQNTSNLPAQAVKPFEGQLSLFKVETGPRRLHAKLLAWEDNNTTRVLVGSANCTTAAFDARNTECCLYFTYKGRLVDDLFGDETHRKRIRLDQFRPSDSQEPEPDNDPTSPILLKSASLNHSGKALIEYALSPDCKPQELSLVIRLANEPHPRCACVFRVNQARTASLDLPEQALAGVTGAVIATLSDEQSGQLSDPYCLIQEARLTHVSQSGSTHNDANRLRETGENLPEFMDSLADIEGLASMVEYLRHLNIRFQDGGGGKIGQRRFRLKLSDPFADNIPPPWLDTAQMAEVENLSAAIYEFCDRHEKSRLIRHAERGNINGIENFLDITIAVVRLLYIYSKRKGPKGQPVVSRSQLVGRLCNLLRIAVGKFKKNPKAKKVMPGYFIAVKENLAGQSKLFQKQCTEVKAMSHLYAIMLIAQYVRFDPNEPQLGGPRVERPGQCLRDNANELDAAAKSLGLPRPQASQIKTALEHFRILTADEVNQLCQEHEQPV